MHRKTNEAYETVKNLYEKQVYSKLEYIYLY